MNKSRSEADTAHSFHVFRPSVAVVLSRTAVTALDFDPWRAANTGCPRRFFCASASVCVRLCVSVCVISSYRSVSSCLCVLVRGLKHMVRLSVDPLYSAGVECPTKRGGGTVADRRYGPRFRSLACCQHRVPEPFFLRDRVCVRQFVRVCVSVCVSSRKETHGLTFCGCALQCLCGMSE